MLLESLENIVVTVLYRSVVIIASVIYAIYDAVKKLFPSNS
jgi:hypothetical protein